MEKFIYFEILKRLTLILRIFIYFENFKRFTLILGIFVHLKKKITSEIFLVLQSFIVLPTIFIFLFLCFLRVIENYKVKIEKKKSFWRTLIWKRRVRKKTILVFISFCDLKVWINSFNNLSDFFKVRVIGTMSYFIIPYLFFICVLKYQNF